MNAWNISEWEKKILVADYKNKTQNETNIPGNYLKSQLYEHTLKNVLSIYVHWIKRIS